MVLQRQSNKALRFYIQQTQSIQYRLITTHCIRCSSPITPTSSSIKNANNNTKKDKKSTLWLLTKLMTPLLALYYYDRYQTEDRIEAEAEKLVSPTQSEINELIQRTQLTSKDIIAIYTQCMTKYQTGLCTIDEFTTLCEQYINNKFEKLKTDTLKSRTPIDTATATIPEQLNELDCVDNEHIVEQRTKPFQAYELYALYRLSPITIQKRYNTDTKPQHYHNVLELLTGLTVLCNGKLKADTVYEEWKQQCTDQKLLDKPPIRYIQSLRKENINKLNLSFLLTDLQRTNQINKQQLIELITILIRTGHVKPISMIYDVPYKQRSTPTDLFELVQYVRAQRVILSPKDIVETYMNNIPYVESFQAVQNVSMFDVIKQSITGNIQQHITATNTHNNANTISKPQFLYLSQHLTTRGTPIQYWYLIPTIQPKGTTASWWYKFKQRVALNVKSKFVIRAVNQLLNTGDNNTTQLTTQNTA